MAGFEGAEEAEFAVGNPALEVIKDRLEGFFGVAFEGGADFLFLGFGVEGAGVESFAVGDGGGEVVLDGGFDQAAFGGDFGDGFSGAVEFEADLGGGVGGGLGRLGYRRGETG